MAKDAILDQIDKLKMMVLMEPPEKFETDLEKYEKWIAKLQGRCVVYKGEIESTSYVDPRQWVEYRTIRNLVNSLYCDKFGNDKQYHENKQEIQRIIAEAIAMTLYIQDTIPCKCHTIHHPDFKKCSGWCNKECDRCPLCT